MTFFAGQVRFGGTFRPSFVGEKRSSTF